MYVSVRNRPVVGTGGRGRVATPVLLIGLTSLLTDVSSEMVSAVLPLFVTVGLGLSPLAFGLVDGSYHGVTALVRFGGGLAADWARRPKLVATAGYGLSAVLKLALLPVSTLAGVLTVVGLDRVGKGIRTGPRDALIAAASPADGLGRAFGVHRALDTAGAMAGPLLAFALLALLPGDYDAVFVVSFCFAVLGVAVIAFLVPEHRARRPAAGTAPGPGRLLRDLGIDLRGRAARRLVMAAGLLAAVTVSDGFLYLVLQEREALPLPLFPLLFVGTALVYMALAAPVGRLADRVGRLRVLVAGHGLLAAAYVCALLPGTVTAVATLALLGAYYAATDGVLAAAAAPVLREQVRATGLALVQTVTALGRFAAAVAFGAVWTVAGPRAALAAFLAALAVALPAAGWLLLRRPSRVRMEAGR